MTKELLLDSGITEEDAANIVDFWDKSGGTPLVGFSGKQGAGKDTVGEKFMDTWCPHAYSVEFFSKVLKDEVNGIIDKIMSETPLSPLANLLNADLKDVKHVKELVEDDLANHSYAQYSAYARTVNMRQALQFWGTEVRRKQDENYWVKRGLKKCSKQWLKGKAVLITDARFPNEIDAINSLGGTTVRLNVSQSAQFERIYQRDGFYPKTEALAHLSETSLDDYTNFTVAVNTDIHVDAQSVTEFLAGNVPVTLLNSLTYCAQKEEKSLWKRILFSELI